MKKTVILYWATGGSVEKSAFLLRDTIGSDKVDLFDLGSFDISELDKYKNLILGIATIGADVWYEATGTNRWNEFFVKLSEKDLSAFKIAAFGLGDQVLYPDNFMDALGYLRDEVANRGGMLIGRWPVEGYEFTESEGVVDGMFCGLALDEDQQPELTSERISGWVDKLNEEMKF